MKSYTEELRRWNRGCFPFPLVYTKPPTKRTLSNHRKKMVPFIIRDQLDVFVILLDNPKYEMRDLLTMWLAYARSVRGKDPASLKLPSRMLREALSNAGYVIIPPQMRGQEDRFLELSSWGKESKLRSETSHPRGRTSPFVGEILPSIGYMAERLYRQGEFETSMQAAIDSARSKRGFMSRGFAVHGGLMGVDPATFSTTGSVIGGEIPLATSPTDRPFVGSGKSVISTSMVVRSRYVVDELTALRERIQIEDDKLHENRA